MTSLFLWWRSTAEMIVYIFLHDFPKRKHCLCRCPADFSYEKLMRYRELCVWCMMVYVLIKSYQNKWVVLGQELTENNLRKWRMRAHNVRSVTSRFSFAGSSFDSILPSTTWYNCKRNLTNNYMTKGTKTSVNLAGISLCNRMYCTCQPDMPK
jgi:hypothetical protein